ncbi:MAG: glycosyl hydrolase, partial [Gemmatimonadetes bacterium]|nr:glycosyl hydrolase [Gemmatimonadota bacterium]
MSVLTAAPLAALALLSGAPSAHAQRAAPAAPAMRYDTTLYSGLRWRNIGPNRGGRSIAVAGSSKRPLEYYFGATGGGVWKTTDGGTTWKPVSDRSLRSSSSVGALAVCEANPDVVYAGMGETELRGNVMQGDGVYRSSDGGKTWSGVGLTETQAVSRIRVHPTDCDRVYVSALGHTYGRNAERGVFRTTDGGKSWSKTLFRGDSVGAVDLALDPRDPQTLYAGLWEVNRTPWSLSSGGAGSGIFRSTDGGATWTDLTRNAGLPAGPLGKIGISVSGANPRRVFAIVEAKEGGVFRSDDAGATWTRVNDERKLRQRAFYYTRIYADPRDTATVYVLNVNFWKSTDGGKTFKSIRTPHGDNHDLWIDAAEPRRMIQSNDGGANVTVNGGESWTEQDYPTAQLYHVVTTRHFPYHVCGAQQDNSTVCVPSNGNGSQFYAVGGGESGYIATDPNNTEVYYAGSYGGLLTRYDRSTGQTRNVQVWPENPMGHSSQDIRERFQWTYPIVFAPTDARVLYTGSQHLWRSVNEGQSWERISPDLTRADPRTLGPSGGPITLDQTGVETYGTIFTIAPSPRDGQTIWVGSDDGVASVTRDGGRTWEKVTPPQLPELSRISLIEASPHQPGRAYLAANRYQQDDRAPYLFRTEDYGKTWTKITEG